MKKFLFFLLLGSLALALGIFLSYKPGPVEVETEPESQVRASSGPDASRKPVDGDQAPPDSSSKSQGSLSVTSTPPGATVYMAGRKVGVTPMTLPGLDPGEYAVKLLLTYHYPHEVTVSVKGGARATVRADLERGKGSLYVVARPVSAQVYLNGVRQKNKTPLKIDGLLSGPQRIRVEAEKYRPREQSVEILPGEGKELVFVLEGGNLEYYEDEWHEPETARKMKEEDVQLLVRRSRAAADAGDFDGAFGMLEEASSILPEYRSVLEAMDMLKTREADEKRRIAREQAAELVEKGNILESEAKYEEALALYREARTIYPEYEGIDGLIRRLEGKVRSLRENRLTGGMVHVRGGFFMMGCASWAGDCDEDARPVHQVEIDDFYMGKYEVTQRNWKELMGENPAHHRGCEDCPVENVGWFEIQEFIERLNKATERQYRLPTEAEWEYAARGGGKSEKWSGTSNPDKLEDYAWYWNNSGQRAHLVGTKLPNGLGLYDMTGNVDEWCSDFYTATYYRASSAKNPAGPDDGPFRVIRGGNWNKPAAGIRTVVRYHVTQGARHNGLGFRLVRDGDD